MEVANKQPGNEDELIIQQQDAIAAEIAQASKLIGQVQTLASLEQDFAQDSVVVRKIKEIEKQYSHMRRTRPDGNCFFRGLGFRLFEILTSNSQLWAEFKKAVQPSKDEMVNLGMPEFTVEDFYDNFMDTVERLNGDEKMSVAELDEIFNEEGTSNYLVVFLRLLVSKELQRDCDFYQNFIEGGLAVKDFCANEVEPMFRESDHIHIIGLTAATKIGVRVIYLDRGEGEKGMSHDFPEGCEPVVHLLYRPGHYDILYPK